MVGEPTTFGRAWFDAFPDAEDATPLLVAARSLKTAQEIERMRSPTTSPPPRWSTCAASCGPA